MSPKDKFFYLYALQDAMQKSVILNIKISQFKKKEKLIKDLEKSAHSS